MWGGIPRQVALRIYANFHKPPRGTVKRHLIAVKPREKPQEKELAGNDEKGDF